MNQNDIKKKVRWLFDTNSIIKIVKHESIEIFEILKSMKNLNYISKITVLEYPKSSKTYEIFNIIDLNQQITDIALKIILNLRKIGELVPISDVLIMSSAEYHEIPLIISDDNHFQIMKKYVIHSKNVISLHDFGKKLISKV